MTTYSMVMPQPWHCGAIARKLRTEQKSIAVGLSRDAHRDLRICYDHSGLVRSWVSNDGRIIAIGGVTGPLLAPEGTVWLAVAEEMIRQPKYTLKETRRFLQFIMTLKTRIHAAPFESDPASIRFAEHLGFVRTEDDTALHGTVPMVLAVDIQAYVVRPIRLN